MEDAPVPCPACGEPPSTRPARTRRGETAEGIGALLAHGALIPFVFAIVLVVQRETKLSVLAVAFAVPILMVAVGALLLRPTASATCPTCGRRLPAP